MVRSAHFSQVNSRTWSRPALTNRARTGALLSTDSTASPNDSTSVGSTRSAASPRTSGKQEAFEATTGVPDAIASSGGKPKPSYSEGYTQTSADAMTRGISSTGTRPSQSTPPARASVALPLTRSGDL